MENLLQFLNIKKNQSLTLEKIKEAMEGRGEWGLYGIFTVIGKKTGFTPAYVGQVLTGKRPLTESFVLKMAEYLGIHHSWLCGEYPYDYETAQEMYQKLWLSPEPEEVKQKFVKENVLKMSAEYNRYRNLIMAFSKIPFEERDRALKILQEMQQRVKYKFRVDPEEDNPVPDEEN